MTKSPEALKVLQSCYVNGIYDISIENGLIIIQEYIKDKKGIEVQINPISNTFDLQLYSIAIDIASEWYLT